MTKKSLVKQLIADYKKAIKDLPLTLKKSRSYLINKNLTEGVCRYSYRMLGHFIGDKKWVQKYVPKQGDELGYWYPTPISSITRAQVKDRLKYRVKILKQILKTCK